MSYSVCILAAGIGSRMGSSLSESFNKAILPLEDKAVISHIIERFPADTNFVIAIGYKAKQVTSYLRLAHPQTNFTFVNVKHYTGPGTGPGYSLKCCKPYLNGPFYFVSCDTLWRSNEAIMNTEKNWVGVQKCSLEKRAEYCNFEVNNGEVVAIHDKYDPGCNLNLRSFIGLMFVKDWQIFWQGFDEENLVNGESQISQGLGAFLASDESTLFSTEFDWLDVGTEELYRDAVSKTTNYDFSKSDESLYMFDGRVIKYFCDNTISRNRVRKAALKASVFPKINAFENGFYSYDLLPGETFYQRGSPEKFISLLNWLSENLWDKVDVSCNFTARCHDFYFEKTQRRLEDFFAKYDSQYSEESFIINGSATPTCKKVLANIDWQGLCVGTPVFIHGDLQFDNILVTDNGDFKLLDWRQDFAGEVEFGDIYYDFAKLYGGIILNYSYIKNNLVSFSEKGGNVTFNFAQDFLKDSYIKILEEFIHEAGYSVKKVRILVGLIYLNMSPLHHYPFDKVLFFLGLSHLHKYQSHNYVKS